MSYTRVGFGATGSFAAATSRTLNVPAGLQQSDLLFAEFGFEAVGAGSAPYIDHTTEDGWARSVVQDPSGSGSGLEIWVANWTSGPSTTFNFTAALTGVGRMVAFRCDSGIAMNIQVTATAQHTGDNPVAPSVTTIDHNSIVIPCASMTLLAPGYTTPAPYNEGIDNARNGTFGNVEIVQADAEQAAPGASGTITFTATTSPAGALGTTATLAATCGDTTNHLLPILGVGA